MSRSHLQPFRHISDQRRANGLADISLILFKAGDEARTHDIHVGNVTLYH